MINFHKLTSFCGSFGEGRLPVAGLKIWVRLRYLRIVSSKVGCIKKLELGREKGVIIRRHRNSNLISNAARNLEG